jgi:hypothetical protein
MNVFPTQFHACQPMRWNGRRRSHEDRWLPVFVGAINPKLWFEEE